MATEVKVPSLGESITTGIIAAWHVKDGDVVSAGQILYELETDKITSEGQAECSGQITLKAAEGDEVEIGQVIAEVDESVAAPAAGVAAPVVEEKKEEPVAVGALAASSGGTHGGVSPAVQRISSETGIDPAAVQGSGKDGRVTKGDMLAVQEKGSAAPTASTPAKSAVPQGERTTRKKMTPMRKKIAERLVSAQHEAAMLTTFNEVDMSPIMKMRKQYQEKFVEKHGVKLGFMSFFVKASVHAMKAIPEINAQIEGNEIVQNHFYDIAIAVGGPKGLMVPVVRDCDAMNFHEIEQSIIGYAKKVKAGKLGIEEMMGGVFTITNGGIYGSMLSTPILNPPQSAILGMHSITERAVVVKSEIVIRPMMYLALSYDHRVVDGKEAVTFLKTMKESLEDPARLMFEL